jgi:hypothetical protein
MLIRITNTLKSATKQCQKKEEKKVSRIILNLNMF